MRSAKERDTETALDYFDARFYASLQGRVYGRRPFDGEWSGVFSSE